MNNDHKHEFIIAWGLGKGIIYCRLRDCGYKISPSDAVRRMNATEYLDAEDAQSCASVYYNLDGPTGRIEDALEDYARTLEGNE
ncbi:hypothetical protein LCGC14_1889990 [marine sediment metagenome]|uniref:Uncharacterized protein n=1 Tax=marine sediment metagenome TaxID=412755 RepID=A0A0F9IXZ8_9ZZZZ